MLLKHEWYVIKKGNLYLMGVPYDDSSFMRWTNSPYDGYRTKSFNTAIRVAKLTGCKVVKHNTLNGRVEGGWK